MQDCWSKDSKLRENARRSAYCVAVNELSEKDRRPTGSIWRDDGLAVDWILDHRKGSMHFMFPSSMVHSMTQGKEGADARRVWMEKIMCTLRRRFPSRIFSQPVALACKMRVSWNDPSGRNDLELPNNSDPTEPRQVTQPGPSTGKRARSPSPTISRKVAKTSTVPNVSGLGHASVFVLPTDFAV